MEVAAYVALNQTKNERAKWNKKHKEKIKMSVKRRTEEARLDGAPRYREERNTELPHIV